MKLYNYEKYVNINRFQLILSDTLKKKKVASNI